MKFLGPHSDGRAIYRFERGERDVFTQVLELFPLKKGAVREISKDADVNHLLEKALDEHRAKTRDDVQKLLRANGEILIDADFNEFWDLKLTEPEIESLLQMLNNVRIGLWYQLGCPQSSDDPGVIQQSGDATQNGRMIMQWCAAWQSMLMHPIDTQE